PHALFANSLRSPLPILLPYTTLFRSEQALVVRDEHHTHARVHEVVDTFGHNAECVDIQAGVGFIKHGQGWVEKCHLQNLGALLLDRKSTRLNSSHVKISYAVFCLKKK